VKMLSSQHNEKSCDRNEKQSYNNENVVSTTKNDALLWGGFG